MSTSSSSALQAARITSSNTSILRYRCSIVRTHTEHLRDRRLPALTRRTHILPPPHAARSFFPITFPHPTGEVNFLAILALLNAYSGYRTTFHKATELGAYQNIIRLMIGLYISGNGDGGEDRVVGSPALTSKGMASLTEAKVVELMGVSVHEEKRTNQSPV